MFGPTESEMRASVAALFVQTGGVYFGRGDVDPWDEPRDAMRYLGPYPVVAHPPCARWCRLAKFVQHRTGKAVGDDGGTFAFALDAVRRWGGVLEHPAWSLAWAAHGLTAPQAVGWHRDIDGGWCCEVDALATLEAVMLERDRLKSLTIPALESERDELAALKGGHCPGCDAPGCEGRP